MLVEFKVANYRSFREEQTLSLVASKDPTHAHCLIDAGKLKLLKTAAVYGPNASGKSNLIKAMEFMVKFVAESATTMNLGEPITGVIPFRLDAKSAGQPSSFSAMILIDGSRYEYGFSVTNQHVCAEWLKVCRLGGRLTNWLDRRFDAKSKRTAWSIRGPLKKDARLLKEKTRDNGLLLSRAADLNVTAITDLFLWFAKKVWKYDLARPPLELMDVTARRVQKDARFRERVLRLVRDADMGISDLKVQDETVHLSLLANELTPTSLAMEFQGNVPRVKLRHSAAASRNSIDFDLFDDESNGTQRFFAIVGPFLDALDDGKLLLVDELECSMHPLLTRKLIELFQDPNANRKGAQLVFVTHDSTLMDQNLFRRDQIWLTQKRRSGATELFSLYDFRAADRPRNTGAFERNYLSGRYGAVPNFGPSLEDLDTR